MSNKTVFAKSPQTDRSGAVITQDGSVIIFFPDLDAEEVPMDLLIQTLRLALLYSDSEEGIKLRAYADSLIEAGAFRHLQALLH